jgi:hypothetical protein
MITCNLCGQSKECFARQIEGREYDICADCWEPIAAKLQGKGRLIKERELVLLPSVSAEPEPVEPKPVPQYPPKIWGATTKQ